MAKRNIFGLLFDPKTGKLTLDGGDELLFGSDFTFEDHDGYNPLQYATQETGEKLIKLITPFLPKDVTLSLVSTAPIDPGPPPQLLIAAEHWGITSEFNAGLIANSYIRSGSFNGFLAELKSAGILF